MADVSIAATRVGADKFEVDQEVPNLGATDRITITGLPVRGTIFGHTEALQAGSGATIQPETRVVHDDASESGLHVATVADDEHSFSGERAYRAGGGAIVLIPAPNTGSDNTVRLQLLVREGWHA